MNTIYHELFKAIHQGKWLTIEYQNSHGEITRYWIAVMDLDIKERRLRVQGFHLTKHTLIQTSIYLDQIITLKVVEGTIAEVNERLIQDIYENPGKYRQIFPDSVNLKILDYLLECHRLDQTPFVKQNTLLSHFDQDVFINEEATLSKPQFLQVVSFLIHQGQPSPISSQAMLLQSLALNVISIPYDQGLYVLAYRRLDFDVSKRRFRLGPLTFLRENNLDGIKVSIRQFLSPSDYWLLDEKEPDLELIRDKITERTGKGVDDLPHLLLLENLFSFDLSKEYEAINQMANADRLSYPLKAFFGQLLQSPASTKAVPLLLTHRNLNRDQLLAMQSALTKTLTYVQGPPGTGKTTLIVQTIITCFTHKKRVLFSSNNNHPLDAVYQQFEKLKYHNQAMPLPILRLGNAEVMDKTLDHIGELIQSALKVKVLKEVLKRKLENRFEETKQLYYLLANYQKILDIKERLKTIEELLNQNEQFHFHMELQHQREVLKKKLSRLGEVRDEVLLDLLPKDQNDFFQYLYYVSFEHIQRLEMEAFGELRVILQMPVSSLEERQERVSAFNRYLSLDENLDRLLQVFPIVISTCISAAKLGKPKIHFELTIIDEASQCNLALSLVPILRGKRLLLVGDPQQLQPVILLAEKDNAVLKERYRIPDEYDYCNSSIYKTYLAADSLSDEILLSYHYRCDEKIADFINRKYYHNRLQVKTGKKAEEPLVFIKVRDNPGGIKRNSAPKEVEAAIAYIKDHPHQNIGVITPFSNQSELLYQALKENHLHQISCGTVHAFQGDEKDTIVFSLCLSETTGQKTYDWLKNNRELINVAVSRAKNKLVVIGNEHSLKKLHSGSGQDDLYELVEYVKKQGKSQVSQRENNSRALGIKPYSTKTEQDFLRTLQLALDQIPAQAKYVLAKEVSLNAVFTTNDPPSDLFYTGRFDFVVYRKEADGSQLPVLAIELDGSEHVQDALVIKRDKQKQAICKAHNFTLIRVPNTYARRYHYIKTILRDYFLSR